MQTELIELVHDKNDKSRPPIGVVLATKIPCLPGSTEGPLIVLGWSRVHSKLDTFDKEKGIQIARSRALNPVNPSGTRNGCIPNYVEQRFNAMRERAGRYFKGTDFFYKNPTFYTVPS